MPCSNGCVQIGPPQIIGGGATCVSTIIYLSYSPNPCRGPQTVVMRWGGLLGLNMHHHVYSTATSKAFPLASTSPPTATANVVKQSDIGAETVSAVEKFLQAVYPSDNSIPIPTSASRIKDNPHFVSALTEPVMLQHRSSLLPTCMAVG